MSSRSMDTSHFLGHRQKRGLRLRLVLSLCLRQARRSRLISQNRKRHRDPTHLFRHDPRPPPSASLGWRM